MLYVFHGPDEVSRGEAAAGLLRDVLPADLADLNTSRLDGAKVTLEELQFASETTPFLAPGRVVLAEGLLARAAKDRGLAERLAAYLPALPPQTHLVLVERDPPPAAGALAAALKAHARMRAFPMPAGRELARWVQERARRLGGSFMPRAADLLVTHVGTDLRLLTQEIQKLVTYTGGERSIDEKDVSLLVGQVLQADVWRFVAALGGRQARVAMAQLHALLGTGQRPEYVLGMVARQVRLLLQAKSLLQEGVRGQELAAALGLRPFPLQRTLEQARRFELPLLVAMHRRVLAADVQIKTGELEPPLALELLVVELCGAERGN